MATIEKACKGLVVTSETDAGVTPVSFRLPAGSPLTPEAVLTLAGLDAKTRVEVSGFREFIEPLGRRRDWHDARDALTAQGFRRLERLLARRLTETAVFRLGERSIDVWVMGRARDGRFVGVRTKVVET